jgi:hypothetical protein
VSKRLLYFRFGISVGGTVFGPLALSQVKIVIAGQVCGAGDAKSDESLFSACILQAGQAGQAAERLCRDPPSGHKI